MPPPLLTGRPVVVVPLILTSFTFFFLFFLSHHHFLSLSASSPSISRRSVLHPFERRQATVTSRITRITTVFTADSVTVTLESNFSSFPASSSDPASSSSVPLPTSVSPSSISAASSSPLSFGSSSTSSSRTTRSATTARTLSSASKKSTSSSTFIPAPTTSDTLILVPTTLSIPTPSTTFILTGNVVSPSTLVVANTATSSNQVVSSSPASVPVQASNSGSGFWSNKGAVGGTFAVVALAALGAIIFLIVTFLKRVRRNRARKLDEELYGNLFEPNQSRSPSPSDARSLTYSAVDPFAAGEVVQIRNGGVSLPTASGMSSGPSAFKNTEYGGSDDGHSSNDHSSSNHHGFSNISYRTGAPDSRADLAQSGPQLSSFYQPPLASLQPHPYNNFSNFTVLPQSTSRVPLAYGNPNVGQDAYYAGQLRSYSHGAGAPGPPGGPAGRAF